jgi:lysophospholipase L1-like esterase
MDAPSVSQQTARGVDRAAPPSARAALVTIAVLLGLAGLLFAVGLVQPFAWSLLFSVLLACVFGACAALVLHDLLVARLAGRPPQWVWLIGPLGTLAGAGVLVLAILQEWVIVAAVDTVLIVLGLIGVVIALGPPATATPTDQEKPTASDWWWFTVGAVGMAASAVVMGSLGWSTVSWIAVVVWVLSLTLLKVRVGPLLAGSPARARRGTCWSAGVGVAGAAVLVLGASWSHQFVLVVGATVAVAGLSVMGICGSRLRLGTVRAWVALAVGVVGVVGAGVATWQIVGDWRLAATLVLLVVIVGAWFVLRGEGFIITVLVCGLVAWAVVDRNDDAAPPPAADGAPRIVGVGDSFISGEGAENFIAGTNTLGDERNECRRSADAYTFRLAVAHEATGVLLACSGAETRDVLTVGQMEHSPPSIPGARPQIDELRDLGLGAGDVVLVSIGGNDVGFSDIVKACLLPAPCDGRENRWVRTVSDLHPILVDTYTQLREAADGAVVIVVPYPNYVPEEECGLGLSQVEHDFVQRFLTRLDSTIVSAARQAGVHVFTGYDTVFDGHRLCQADPAANHLQLRPPDGPGFSRFSPETWAHGPMHPNERGHRLLAEALDELVTEALAPGATNPAPQESDRPDTPTSEQLESVDDIADDEWIADRLWEAAMNLIIPLSAAMVMAIVGATGFVQRKNKVAQFLAP